MLNKFKIDDYEKKSFDPLYAESKRLDQPFEKIFKTSEDIQKDIVETVNKGDYDLLLVGIGQSIFKGSLLGNLLGHSSRFLNPDYLFDKVSGKEKIFKTSPFAESTMNILAKSKSPVGILIDNDLHNVDKIFLPFFGTEDHSLVEYVRRFISNAEMQITICDIAGNLESDIRMKESLRAIEQQVPNHVAILEKEGVDIDFIKKHDLVLVSLEGWEKLVRSNSTWLKDLPSVLILRS